LRAGCLLAASAAVNLEKCPNFLFWQPALAGKLLLQQFLRLKMAGELIGNDTKGVTEQLRRQLAEGGIIEVAGYRLSPALTNGLEAAELQLPPRRACRMDRDIAARRCNARPTIQQAANAMARGRLGSSQPGRFGAVFLADKRDRRSPGVN